jgi:hypothetical protein
MYIAFPAGFNYDSATDTLYMGARMDDTSYYSNWITVASFNAATFATNSVY